MWHVMKVTPDIRNTIQRGLSAKGMNQAGLAVAIGRHRSWVSKLLDEDSDKVQNLSGKMADKISDKLDIELRPIHLPEGEVTPTALGLSELSESMPALALLLAHLLELVDPDNRAYIPTVHQKDLIKVGAELTTIVMRWEEGTDPHYAKIGGESLDYLREFFSKPRRKP